MEYRYNRLVKSARLDNSISDNYIRALTLYGVRYVGNYVVGIEQGVGNLTELISHHYIDSVRIHFLF